MNQQYSKAHFCKKYVDDNGIQTNRRPVWYDEDQGYNGKVTRVFVSASWFPTWEEWQPQAEKALTAATVEYDSFNGTYVKRGSSYPIVGTPQFLLERSSIWQGGFLTWVNALCPNRAEFERVVAEAKERIESNGKPRAGMRVASITDPLPMLPISSAEFQDEPGTIGAVWGK